MPDYATIQVKAKTKKLLEKAKAPGESFDDLIRRKLTEAEAANELAFLREVNSLLNDRKSMRRLR